MVQKLRRDITLPRYQSDTFVAPAASEQDSADVAPSEGSLTLLDEEVSDAPHLVVVC